MCDHGCSKAVDCTHVREGDEWIAAADLRRTPADGGETGAKGAENQGSVGE